jgi:hypothetical protein
VSFGGDAALVMEIGGITPGTGHDQISVTGDLALDGALEVSILLGFTPTAGQSFNILDWFGTRSGTFSSLSLPTLAGLAWNTSQLYTDGIISVAAAGVPGDYNQDGTVDAADYTVWRNNLGSLSSLPNDDTPGVGPDDYERWKSHFGQPAGSGALGAESAVPEPQTMVLLLLAAANVVARRNRRWFKVAVCD